MKRTLFITVGAIALFVIFSVWLYLLLFGTPKSVTEVVGEFGFGGVNATPINPNLDNSGDERQINLVDGTLYQLTTKPVAGFGFFESESGTEVLYAERGLGHIYRIDISTGAETRVSQKTFVAVNRAYFSDDGSAAVLVEETPFGTVSHLEELGPNQAPHTFPAAASNIAFNGGREVYYTVTNDAGTIGYSYQLDTTETDVIFSTALRDINVIWNAGDPLVYSKSASALRGSLYRASGNILSSTGASGLSFSALANPATEGEVITTYPNPNTGLLVSHTESNELGITTLPDKCAFDSLSSNILWCGSPLNLISPQDQSDWYKGLISFMDLLWRVDLTTGEAQVEVDLLTLTGREVDVLDLTINNSSDHLLFKNKNDDALWLKRLADTSSAAADEELLSDSEEITDGEI